MSENWFPGSEGTHYAGVAIPETETEVEIIDCPDCDGSGEVRNDFPARVNRPGEEQRVTCQKCNGLGEVEDDECEAGECDEKRKPGDTLCESCATTRDEARAAYRTPYTRAEIDDAYSDPTERAKRECLSHLDSIWIRGY